MPDRPETKIIKHSLSLLFFLAAFIVMLFSYYNNAWIVIENPEKDGMFMRGLNNDCYNSTITEIKCRKWNEIIDKQDVFPDPFKITYTPGFWFNVSLWTARLLFVIVAGWLGITFTCCCKWAACKVRFERNKQLLELAVLSGGIVFVFLMFTMGLVYVTGPSIPNLPEGYTESLGSGFWRFVLAGLVLYAGGAGCFFWDKRSSNESTAHRERVSMHEVEERA